MLDLFFEWDEEKARSNERKHRVTFERARRAFYDPFAIEEPESFVDGELRWQLIGAVDDLLLLIVVHTYRQADGEDIIRMISARPTTPKERRRYERETGQVSF